MPSASSARLRALAVLLLVAAAGLRLMLSHASAERAGFDAELQAEVVRVVGSADLALSSSSRWLRHPGSVESGAPFQDFPAALDPDPAGACIGPPRALWEVRPKP